ncbi:putative ORFan [Tupanvirus deep ocean]|uniref:ORFan n=1 Tax=Tupanvirus soda lake TaxID=2126985 RepID=A0AC59HBT8_9VIRU|nr:putative ORFan [Tupanvirus deep ocean]AUL79466.2 putative ORFan [Tupanvirus deep ocean]
MVKYKKLINSKIDISISYVLLSVNGDNISPLEDERYMSALDPRPIGNKNIFATMVFIIL